MSVKLSLFVILALFSIVSARVIRQAPDENKVFSDAVQSIGTQFSSLQEAIFKAYGVKNEEEFNNKIKAQGHDIATAFDGNVAEANKQFDEFKNSDAFKNFITKAEEIATEFTNSFKKNN
ncbi:uncharacterized protein LOC119666673 [Teleopsis dalmanni]|uniref:uncharacterized protein LOC119666673 n=1 Tax=Teleopsis dalmanni TaxID=139649 RepID=UPI000D32BC9B|nr:uncharacterized protein LOC119666673 [Teleopsis dalmanni]